MESNFSIEKWNEVLFVCWNCGRVEFVRREDLAKLIDLDATLEYELHKTKVRNLAVFGVRYEIGIEQIREQADSSRKGRLFSARGS
jgi:hypothetical protein